MVQGKVSYRRQRPGQKRQEQLEDSRGQVRAATEGTAVESQSEVRRDLMEEMTGAPVLEDAGFLSVCCLQHIINLRV